MVMLGWEWEGLKMLAEDVLFVRSQSEEFRGVCVLWTASRFVGEARQSRW